MAPKPSDAFHPEHDTPLLPLGILWVYLVAPFALTILMGDMRTLSAEEFLRSALCNYIPFIGYGAFIWVLYRKFMPQVLARVPTPQQRAVVHVLVIVGSTLLLAYPVGVVHKSFIGDGASVPFGPYALVSIVVSLSTTLPALMVQRLRLRAQAAERAFEAERRASLRAQLDALQARTDPHFLFNSLNTVAALIPEDPARAERSVEQLADLFRYALEAGRTRTVPLSRELEMTTDYLALQSARFGERLRVTLDVAQDIDDVQVPPLLLQPLVENAIKHGAESRHGGEVTLRARREDETLVIEVIDDGPGPGASAQKGTGSALLGIVERLRLHYAGHADFTLEARAGMGCLARVRLPVASPHLAEPAS